MAMSSPETSPGSVSAVKAGELGYVEFDHQARRNAMSIAMWRALPDVCAELQNDDSVRVVILRGAGMEAFVSGADISEFNDTHRPGTAGYNTLVGEAYAAVAALRKPTIAQIDGYCVGGGLAIAASTDFRIAADNSSFGLPPARLGVGYSPSGIGALVDLIGPAAVNEMVFSADLIDAETAARWGLVNHVVPVAELGAFVEARALAIAARAPMSQYAAKLAVRAHLDPTSANHTAAHDAAEACLHSADYAEGIVAFNEKRAPRFTGS
jgi:enoyl-CoA hydratase